MSTTAITLQNLSKHYNNHWVLRRLSCSIQNNTTTLLLGNNGAGKSTLLKLIAGTLKPSFGSLEIFHEHIAYIGHSSAMYPQLSALENLVFWQKLYNYNSTKEQCIAVLEEVNLYTARNKETRFFSKGMLQRLHLALLLLQQPNIILLDEPNAGLDRDSNTLLYDIISAQQQKQVTILWVTHQPQQDIAYATHILALHDTKIQFYGSIHEYQDVQNYR